MADFNDSSDSGNRRPVLPAVPALEELVASARAADLIAAAGHAMLTEDLAFALLKNRDLPPQVLEALTRNTAVMQHRQVLVQVVGHPRTPRHFSLPLLRRLFVFELMQVALEPAVAADLKLLAEEVLIQKLDSVSLGEVINLARRCSAKPAAALLLREERQVIDAALQNPRITEAEILKVLGRPEVPSLLLFILMDHPKWGLRRELQIAVLRRPESSDELVTRIAARLPRTAIRELFNSGRLSAGREALLRRLTVNRDPNI